MKNIHVINIICFIVFLSGVLKAEESDLPAPDELQESFLVGSRDEKNRQCSKEEDVPFVIMTMCLNLRKKEIRQNL